jgi:hypothetical protein
MYMYAHIYVYVYISLRKKHIYIFKKCPLVYNLCCFKPLSLELSKLEHPFLEIKVPGHTQMRAGSRAVGCQHTPRHRGGG